jgi:hypothetical protein
MTKQEAIRIATKFVDSRPDLNGAWGDVIGLYPADNAVRLPARFREKNTSSDAWLVRFRYRLSSDSFPRLPSGLTIEVDIETGEADVMETM